ncbi:flagellar hook-length control protein FliK [Desulfurispirillum indicum]|uniref:flagellar hook-length control protein FliK n=1 Tax=Desulfurispirillum indicum TaxID=936456 RepID=UPI001CFABC60|nr:flagellar hook-length control protein FliK [Desulfurispirillum indicum]UCZ55577.1 flagellar hook-length control protein FliK [Desulfurispirillum indicum]
MITQILDIGNFPLLKKADKGTGSAMADGQQGGFLQLLFQSMDKGASEKNSPLLPADVPEAEKAMERLKQELQTALESLPLSGRSLRQLAQSDVLTPQFNHALQDILNQNVLPPDSIGRALIAEVMDFNSTVMNLEKSSFELSPQQLSDLTLLIEKFSAHRKGKDDKDQDVQAYHHLERSLLFGALFQKQETVVAPDESAVEDPDTHIPADLLARTDLAEELGTLVHFMKQAGELFMRLMDEAGLQPDDLPAGIAQVFQGLMTMSAMMEEVRQSRSMTPEHDGQILAQVLDGEEGMQHFVQLMRDIESLGLHEKQPATEQALQRLVGETAEGTETARQLGQSLAAMGMVIQANQNPGRTAQADNTATPRQYAGFEALLEKSPLRQLVEAMNRVVASDASSESLEEELSRKQQNANRHNGSAAEITVDRQSAAVARQPVVAQAAMAKETQGRDSELARAVMNKALEAEDESLQEEQRPTRTLPTEKTSVTGRENTVTATGATSVSAHAESSVTLQAAGSTSSTLAGQPFVGQQGSSATQSSLTPESAPESAGRRVDMDSVIDQILRKVSVHQSGSLKTITVALNPQHLGKVHIRLSIENAQLVGRLMVEDSGLRENMQRAAAQLREALTNMGLRVERFEIVQPAHQSAAQDNQSQFSEEFRHARNDQQGERDGGSRNHDTETHQNQGNHEHVDDTRETGAIATSDALDITV